MEERLGRLFARHPDVDIQVSRTDGTIPIRSDRIRDRGLPLPGRALTAESDVFENFSVPGDGRFRMLSRLTTGAGLPLLVQVARSLNQNDRQLGELLVIMLLAGSLAVGCTLGGGYLLARQALAPVDRMAASAEEITASQLDRRLHAPNPDDELGRLARTLNGMIGRLERSFEEVRRFTADAAHELRTPLAILRNEAEVALRIPRDSEQYRDCLEDMLEEIEHLSRLSEDLLLLFREDAGLGAQARDVVRLDQLVCEIADHLRVLAAEAKQELTAEASLPCQVHGQRAAAPSTRLQSGGQRDQVHASRREDSPPGRVPEGPGSHHRRRYGDRHRAGTSAAHLRPVLPGRFRPQPADRRKRPGPFHLPLHRRVAQGNHRDRK